MKRDTVAQWHSQDFMLDEAQLKLEFFATEGICLEIGIYKILH
jgi:hypothetical protein